MLTIIHHLLDSNGLQALHLWLDDAIWGQGRDTAGPVAAMVKQNQQVAETSPGIAQQRQQLLQQIAAHPVVQSAALPTRMGSPLFAQYSSGMGYGEHCDNALMLNGGLRADLAYTLFLSDPQGYDGGELVVNTDLAPASIKLPAGSLVLYPASTLHRVNPVSRGLRRVAVGWMQSQLREPAQRELFLDLTRCLTRLSELEPNGAAHRLLEKSRQNLLRMWS